MKHTNFKLGKLLVIISIILFISGIGLLIWAGIGQFITQLNFDGQYKTFRIILCAILVVISSPLFIIGINLID